MARYIDADRITFWIRQVSSNGLDFDVRKIAFSDEIARMPTADVAPKSEVERLTDLNNQLECDIVNANMNLEHVTQELQGVARKIIDDFDEELHKLAERYYEQGKIEYFTLCEVIYQLVIAKIKKKYTEERE